MIFIDKPCLDPTDDAKKPQDPPSLDPCDGI